ncbi:hypothetical protein MGU_10883 [Metarhizium guizhouense ARSEF 977]|uniref:SCP domain-containing protein n=1 Tax=Metarhizium guizhouense (strain ARSEF 977) TaxID=1276136 RepID=A0A0B4GPV7_METGA|nr:hypothetical protein MGU_10883 [Metarhizium guizhouense ARSEF 977]
MRSSLLITVLPLVGAIPRSSPGERDVKTTVSKRGWSGHDVWNGDWNNHESNNWGDWSNWWPDWSWPGKPSKPNQPNQPNQPEQPTEPEQPGGDDSCEPDDGDEPAPPQDPTPTKPVETPGAPPTQPSPSPTQAPPPGGNGPDYINAANEILDLCELRHLAHDPKMETNAKKTCADANGQLKHEMNPGTMGQVMAQGECTAEGFKRSFAGGWLCEIPSLYKKQPNFCSTSPLAQGWNYQGQTGHAEILSNTKYTLMGCGCEDKIWTCDLAY